jgi:hypothetical protein
VGLVGIAALGFWFVTQNQPWPAHIKALLLGSIIASVWFQGPSTIHSAPLLIHNRLKSYYGVALSTGVVRLALCAALYSAGLLSGWVLSWIGALLIAASAFFYRRLSKSFVDEQREVDAEAQRALFAYLKPLIVGLMFYAFQGQIAMLLITKFGSTLAVAQVGALGRLGQVLMVLEACNTVLFAPAIARASTKELPRRYTQILIGAVSAATIVTGHCLCVSSIVAVASGPRLRESGKRSRLGHSHLGDAFRGVGAVGDAFDAQNDAPVEQPVLLRIDFRNANRRRIHARFNHHSRRRDARRVDDDGDADFQHRDGRCRLASRAQKRLATENAEESQRGTEVS